MLLKTYNVHSDIKKLWHFLIFIKFRIGIRFFYFKLNLSNFFRETSIPMTAIVVLILVCESIKYTGIEIVIVLPFP